MEQLELFSIPSPCVGVCQSDSKGYCRGCFRNRDERVFWLKLTDAQKRKVLRLCRNRQRKMQVAAKAATNANPMMALQLDLEWE